MEKNYLDFDNAFAQQPGCAFCIGCLSTPTPDIEPVMVAAMGGNTEED
ncbi:MAG: hypothetical protein WHS77_09755 [Brevinematales bacterium]